MNETDGTDEYGDIIKDISQREIFAEIMSIGQTEFYQAHEVGKKPEIKVKIADYLDYAEETKIIYDSKIYKVLRTYRTRSNELEITLYGGVKLAST